MHQINRIVFVLERQMYNFRLGGSGYTELKICKDHSPADRDIFKGILRICAQLESDVRFSDTLEYFRKFGVSRDTFWVVLDQLLIRELNWVRVLSIVALSGSLAVQCAEKRGRKKGRPYSGLGCIVCWSEAGSLDWSQSWHGRTTTILSSLGTRRQSLGKEQTSCWGGLCCGWRHHCRSLCLGAGWRLARASRQAERMWTRRDTGKCLLFLRSKPRAGEGGGAVPRGAGWLTLTAPLVLGRFSSVRPVGAPGRWGWGPSPGARAGRCWLFVYIGPHTELAIICVGQVHTHTITNCLCTWEPPRPNIAGPITSPPPPPPAIRALGWQGWGLSPGARVAGWPLPIICVGRAVFMYTQLPIIYVGVRLNVPTYTHNYQLFMYVGASAAQAGPITPPCCWNL